MKCFSATISCRRAAAARRIGLVGAVASMLLPAPAAEAQSMAVKRLYAPATDVESGAVVLPTPREAASASQAAILFAPRAPRVRFDFATGGGVVRIAPLGPDAIAWSLSITEPGRAPAPLVGDAAELGRSGDSRLDARSGAGADGRSDGWADERNDGSTDPRRNLHESVRGMVRATERIAGQDAFGSPEPTRMIEFASLGGALRIDAALPVQPAPAEAALLLDDDGEAALLAYPVRWDLAAGEDLAFVVEARLPAPAAAPLADATLAARARAGQPMGLELRSATVRWADGSTGHPVAVEPFDGGAVVRFSRARAGDALVRIDADAVDRGGARWTRSTATIVPVAGSRTTLVGLPRLESAGAMPTGGWVDLLVPLATDEAVVFVAAELWAEGAGRPRCLGWIGGMTEIERRAEWQSDRGVARIGCASARLALAPGESLVCRNLRVHARDGFAPRLLADAAVDTAGLELDGDAFASAPPPNGPAADFGMPGIASVPAASQRSLIPGVGSHALVLTHGYCADENPWPLAQFSSDAWPYTDLNANRSHDWFALDIASDASQFKSYGIIGHSQGGCAALHLYAFYWSGLDWAGPGRLIQAVGSPFEGTPIAGNLAALGEVFGVQCGSNYDLTTAGAAAWLSAIPTSARAKVYTHTTTFTNNPFFYDYCNIFVDPFLSDPEDGVVEHASGHFPGANDMGLRSGWCHVSGMRDPAQTNDGNRNATMNAEAAR